MADCGIEIIPIEEFFEDLWQDRLLP